MSAALRYTDYYAWIRLQMQGSVRVFYIRLSDVRVWKLQCWSSLVMHTAYNSAIIVYIGQKFWSEIHTSRLNTTCSPEGSTWLSSQFVNFNLSLLCESIQTRQELWTQKLYILIKLCPIRCSIRLQEVQGFPAKRCTFLIERNIVACIPSRIF